jgi:hypothetical protein
MAVVERWYAELAIKGLHGSTTELVALINQWIETSNEDPRCLAWYSERG